MKARILGYKITTIDNGTGSHGFDENSKTFVFFVEDEEGDDCFFTATEEHSSCGSGYTSASYGYIYPDLKHEYIGLMKLVKPIKDIFITVVDKNVQVSIQDPDEDNYDSATVTIVKSTDGEIIVSATGDGGCSFYSSGIVTLNEDLFEKQ